MNEVLQSFITRNAHKYIIQKVTTADDDHSVGEPIDCVKGVVFESG